jgi:hypothetical protein
MDINQNDYPIVYLGMRKVSNRRWIHIGYDTRKNTIVPMPKHLVPERPEPKHP